ncbi:oxalurate catabolism protein HpxZ [Pseudomonas sp. KNUC1026]|uniref:oxalurate catabolism protein HpxZ n=1 Tax=Pseudomonas sp. KNUC1026 TaxID=2893890 RepID=UPI001F169E3F|nr:oxalurate catabolism protein HpxZ [Pseudomonas sp. KNUC1026]UFH48931.1 oxalurate catabolism protein HpxZ [Pseudomonas sp. KNUC1026]
MSPEQIDQPQVLAEVTAAFERYEQALVSNDTAVLDELFWNDERTVRLGATENLYGITAIRAFRNARLAAGLQRALRNTVITTYGDAFALCSTEFTREGSERVGRQQQTWVKMKGRWRIVGAQVSLMG